MSAKGEPITVRLEELDAMQKRLSKFMDGLPENERAAMAVILARAAHAIDNLDGEIDDHLLALGEPGPPTIPMLARALDGRSEFRDDIDGTKSIWSYTVWTYNHKD